MSQESGVLLTELEMYFRLIWLFVGIISFLFLSLCYLYLTMRRSQAREKESLEFSRDFIEGQEDERRRVTMELHDTVLPEVRRFIGTDGAAAAGEAVVRQQELVSRLLRQICARLLPPDFERTPPHIALKGLCVAFAKRSGIACVAEIDEDIRFGDISGERLLHIYRMVQEAFTNIEKHSGAANAILVARNELRGNVKTVLLCISDDGRGLENDTRNAASGIAANGAYSVASSAGLGIRTMRARAQILGGSLDFISEDGNGLMVRIEVPILPPPHHSGNF